MPGLKDWLRKAASDLKLASKAIGDDETLDPAVYLTHQSVEKSLKAFFIFTRRIVPKTHDLESLCADCIMLDNEFLLMQKDCILLNPYGFNARYPKDGFYINQKDLIGALHMAGKIFDFVKNKVSKK